MQVRGSHGSVSVSVGVLGDLGIAESHAAVPEAQSQGMGAAPVVKAKLPSFESYLALFDSVRAGLVRAHSPSAG